MRWHEALSPLGMQRVALLAPQDALRELLVNVADQGTVELDEVVADEAIRSATPAAARLARLNATLAAPALAPTTPDLDRCEQEGRLDLIAGEAQLEQRSAQALSRGSVAALTGWMPSAALSELAGRVAGRGGAVVPLPRPPGAERARLPRGEGIWSVAVRRFRLSMSAHVAAVLVTGLIVGVAPADAAVVPVVSVVSPASGKTAAGTRVTVSGSGFSHVT